MVTLASLQQIICLRNAFTERKVSLHALSNACSYIIYRVSHKNDPLYLFAKISVITETFQAKIYTHIIFNTYTIFGV